MFQPVKIPKAGYHTPGHAIGLWVLDVTVGERHEDSTEIIVRGRATTVSPAGTQSPRLCLSYSWPFAGTIVLREGRDCPEHDLVVYAKTLENFEGELAIVVSLALDEHSDVTAKEMERICE